MRSSRMANGQELVSFDWALKNILRSKTNFDVLEGFLSEFMKDEIKVQKILETDHEDEINRQGRIYLMVKNSKSKTELIVIQYERECDYFFRILHGIFRTITEHLEINDPYSKISNVILINILFFDLGKGNDYVYKGETDFRALHRDESLLLKGQQKEFFGHEIFPEYYLLKVNQFNDEIRSPLDEWIYFLKNNEIKEEFSAKGLVKAREVLRHQALSGLDQLSYEEYLNKIRLQESMIETIYDVGKMDDFKQKKMHGWIEAKIEAKIEMAKSLKKQGVAPEIIAKASGLSVADVKNL